MSDKRLFTLTPEQQPAVDPGEVADHEPRLVMAPGIDLGRREVGQHEDPAADRQPIPAVDRLDQFDLVAHHADGDWVARVIAEVGVAQL